MLPNFLVPETEERANGESEVVELGESKGKLLSLTLGITRIIEQESLDVTIVGSTGEEGAEYATLISFPQKFYCGTYSLLLDLSKHPEVSQLKVTWKMGRWGRGEPKPLFGFYLFAEDASEVAATAAG
jgi:hypothetical protein